VIPPAKIWTALQRGKPVAHVLGVGGLEAHRDAMERLLDLTALPGQELFRSRQELVSQALASQEEKVAFVDEGPPAAAGASEDTQ